MKKGFTLIELLVTITVIGILATLVIANFSSTRERARDTKRKSDLRQLKTALRLYYNDFQTYPADSSGQIQGCGSSGTSNCTWGSSFTAGSTEYMRILPTDPLNSGSNVYIYAQTNSGDGFTLTTYLENASDADSTTSQNNCGITPVVANQYVICQD